MNGYTQKQSGWWLGPSEKYEFVSWDDEIPNFMWENCILYIGKMNNVANHQGDADPLKETPEPHPNYAIHIHVNRQS